jgi:MFS transporter, MCT family, solute carrier family 16 (monocarboxylic acid transporters), member 9
LGSIPSFGLVFGDFLTDLGEETSAIALITSCFFCALSFAGLFTNTLIKKSSIRTVGLVGAGLYFIGSLLTIFVTSVSELLVGFSIFQGAGFGFMIPVAYTTFNAYFVERRVVFMSISQTLIGLGTMVYPIVIQLLMDKYGFRGCLAVLAAINAHAIVGMLIMQPVAWHMQEVADDAEEVYPMMLITPAPDNKEVDGKINENFSPKALSVLKDGEKNERRRASSIPSLGNWAGPVIVSDVSERDTKPPTKWQVLVDFLDLRLLKDPIYLNIVLGISFANYSDTAFFTIQPLYLFMLGFSKVIIARI